MCQTLFQNQLKYLRNDYSSLPWRLLSPCGPEVCAQRHRHSSCDRQGWLCWLLLFWQLFKNVNEIGVVVSFKIWSEMNWMLSWCIIHCKQDFCQIHGSLTLTMSWRIPWLTRRIWSTPLFRLWMSGSVKPAAARIFQCRMISRCHRMMTDGVVWRLTRHVTWRHEFLDSGMNEHAMECLDVAWLWPVKWNYTTVDPKQFVFFNVETRACDVQSWGDKCEGLQGRDGLSSTERADTS